MTSIKDPFLGAFNAHAGANPVELDNFEREAGFVLPGAYRQFLLRSNGGEGFVGPNEYVILWRVEELRSLNDGYEVELNAPGLLLFGTNGGGEAYAFDRTSEGLPIVSVPFVGMRRSAAWPQARDFDAFLKRLYEAA